MALASSLNGDFMILSMIIVLFVHILRCLINLLVKRGHYYMVEKINIILDPDYSVK